MLNAECYCASDQSEVKPNNSSGDGNCNALFVARSSSRSRYRKRWELSGIGLLKSYCHHHDLPSLVIRLLTSWGHVKKYQQRAQWQPNGLNEPSANNKGAMRSECQNASIATVRTQFHVSKLRACQQIEDLVPCNRKFISCGHASGSPTGLARFGSRCFDQWLRGNRKNMQHAGGGKRMRKSNPCILV